MTCRFNLCAVSASSAPLRFDCFCRKVHRRGAADAETAQRIGFVLRGVRQPGAALQRDAVKRFLASIAKRAVTLDSRFATLAGDSPPVLDRTKSGAGRFCAGLATS